ncbi:hypothetical protein A3F06_02355 [candidate division TM6 bacterium RIFCSPHIGHO2_12_FULL_36_22]|nr:MAG: hypothetical protein A3F06_02355 [candidate division TM6 bacterium RIFCSPHIGHO2_12_FULL_36_22]
MKRLFKIFLLVLTLAAFNVDAMNYNVGRTDQPSFGMELAKRMLWAGGGFAAGTYFGNTVPLVQTDREKSLREKLKDLERRFNETEILQTQAANYAIELEIQIKEWECEYKRLEEQLREVRRERTESYSIQGESRKNAAKQAAEKERERCQKEVEKIQEQLNAINEELETRALLLNQREETNGQLVATLNQYRLLFGLVLHQKEARQKTRSYFRKKEEEWRRDHPDTGEPLERSVFEEDQFSVLLKQKFIKNILGARTKAEKARMKKPGERKSYYAADSDVEGGSIDGDDDDRSLSGNDSV